MSSSQMYKKSFGFEIKAADSGAVEGLASTFNNVDHVGDTVAKGAFTKSISSLKTNGRVLPMLHEHYKAIGAWKTFEETKEGLFVSGQALVDEVQEAREAIALAKADVVTGLSIGFMLKRDDFDFESDGTRIIRNLDLMEVSLVASPADDFARISAVKSMIDRGMTTREFEGLLRDSGFSRKQAARMAGPAIQALQGDPEDDLWDADLKAMIDAVRRTAIALRGSKS